MVRRTAWLALASAVVAAMIFLVFRWSDQWNHPQRSTAHVSGEWQYHHQPITVSIDCKGPSALVGTRLANYTVHIRLQPASAWKPWKSQMPVAPHGSASSDEASSHQTGSQAEAAKPNYVWVWLDASNATAKIHDGSYSGSVGSEDDLASGIQSDLSVDITPAGTGPVSLRFNLGVAFEGQTSVWGDVAAGAEWSPETRAPFVAALLPYALSLGIFAALLTLFLFVSWRSRLVREGAATKLSEYQRADGVGETHLAWETARIKLDEYFNRNLLQVNLVFWVAVVVMAVGFGFVLMGVVLSLRSPENVTTAILAGVSGVITQFIGATFMVIYRSIMQQANGFMSVLERINAAGMAVSELERIPEELKEVKSKVRAQFAESLLGGNHGVQAAGS